jgi:hypothetical protein
MSIKKKITTIIFLIMCLQSVAQDTLPKFTLFKKLDGGTQLDWINDYGIVKQITIQRSTDSLKRFASIGSDTTPMDRRGFFIDKKAKLTNYFYRIFIQLPEGKYFYTSSKRLPKGTKPSTGPIYKLDTNKTNTTQIYNKALLDSLLKAGLDSAAIKKLDSTIFVIPKPVFTPSDYIFTDKKGNVLVLLPSAESKFYSISFFDENNRKVLFIKKVQESNLILERYNFYKSGWYFFEIKEKDTLIEKHKFYLPPLIITPLNGKTK